MTTELDLTQFDGHTPGPWHNGEDMWACVTTHPDAHGVVIAQASVMHGRIGEPSNELVERANARLIAAAPALLAEVERLTACLVKANRLAEHFEREWYLRGDRAEGLAAALQWIAPKIEPHGGRHVRSFCMVDGETCEMPACRIAREALARYAPEGGGE
jgi:hypothetical protein